MDKRDAGRYKYSRRGGSEFSVQNQNQNQNSVDKIQQPPWKLGISGSSGSGSTGSHNRPQKTSIPEKSRFPTVDTTKSVCRNSFRTLGTRQFEEKQKQKQTFVGESSSSNNSATTGKTVTQVLDETDVTDFYLSVCTQATSSNSSSGFLSHLNKQLSLGSSSNSTGSGMQRRGGIKSIGCTSVSDVISSSAEGVRKRVNGEGSSTRARSLTGANVDLNVPPTIRGVPQAGSRIHRVFARTSEIDFQASQANWTLASSQEDQRSEEEDDEEDVGQEEEEEEEEEEAAAAQPRPFAFLLPHQMFAASNQSRWDSSSGSVLDSIPNSSSDYTSGLSSRMSSQSGEEGSGRASHRVVQRGLRLRDREPYQRDRIAEVLLALERIEQHGDLTHDEQLLILETNFLLNGLTFHDEHRDMRMDIDNMSYEELLALEEKMGTVSTALSEEEFANCLERSLYHESSPHSIDDVKCSICQEEYENGDEIGVLKCKHWYHVSCIHEWLRQKNWCPVCKAPQNDR